MKKFTVKEDKRVEGGTLLGYEKKIVKREERERGLH